VDQLLGGVFCREGGMLLTEFVNLSSRNGRRLGLR